MLMSLQKWTTSLTTLVLLLMALPVTSGATQEGAAVGREPNFPTGPSYETFTATLPGLGLLLDTDADGKVNDEWCDSDGEARLAVVGATFRTLVAAGTLCGALPPGAKEVCFGGLAVAAAALESEATVIAQCAFQDSLVDGAVMEAAYENTRHALASRLERNLARCDALLSLQLPQANGGRAEELRGLLQTRIEQFETIGQFPALAQRARVKLDKGTMEFDRARYRAAFNDWCAAYNILQNTPP
jgi:hypothetical protein